MGFTGGKRLITVAPEVIKFRYYAFHYGAATAAPIRHDSKKQSVRKND